MGHYQNRGMVLLHGRSARAQVAVSFYVVDYCENFRSCINGLLSCAFCLLTLV